MSESRRRKLKGKYPKQAYSAVLPCAVGEDDPPQVRKTMALLIRAVLDDGCGEDDNGWEIRALSCFRVMVAAISQITDHRRRQDSIQELTPFAEAAVVNILVGDAETKRMAASLGQTVPEMLKDAELDGIGEQVDLPEPSRDH